MTYTTIAVIYNPNSTGSGQDLAKAFAKSIKARLPKQKVELRETKYAGHAEELAYDIAKASKNPLVISSSGDGGYNEVINGALKAQAEGATVTTGLLPAGNANDHYHNLHDEDFVELVASGKAKSIDVLKMKGTSEGAPIERYAHSYIGIGLTPEVGNELNKTKLNVVKEVLLVARVLLFVKSIRLKLAGEEHHYDSVIFSNVDTMSKYLKISQPSSTTDGKFEVTIFRRRNKLRLISVLLKASLVGVKEDHRVASYSLETVKKTLVQADGEIVTLDAGTTMVVSAQKQVLRCVV